MRRSPRARKRVADYRVIIVETEQALGSLASDARGQQLVVTRIGPRGNVYD